MYAVPRDKSTPFALLSNSTFNVPVPVKSSSFLQDDKIKEIEKNVNNVFTKNDLLNFMILNLIDLLINKEVTNQRLDFSK